MKLATFVRDGTSRVGVVLDDAVLDLSVQAPDLPTDMLSLLQQGDKALDKVRSVREKGGDTIPLAGVSLRQPVIRPPKILAIAVNYADHLAETPTEKPPVQLWFNKQSTCANGPYDPIELPVASDKLDYEGELGVIIGKTCRHVPKDRAHEVIAGFTVVNDVSVRDWQWRAQTFQIGKSFDTHGPFGPFLVTPDEVGDPQHLDIKTWVNDELRQDSNTKFMIYDIRRQIEHLTTAFTLEPGDLLVTGTPAGIGAVMNPPRFLEAGDVVRIEIEKVGAIENRIVEESGETVIR